MKRIIAGMILAGAVALTAGTEAEAAGRHHALCTGAVQKVTTGGINVCEMLLSDALCKNSYVDGNGDGVCDNYTGQGFGGQGQGSSYVDGNGDGVCDNYTGQGFGGQGQGSGYVDGNGDGVCDNYTGQGFGSQGQRNQGQAQGAGAGHGCHGQRGGCRR